MEGTARHEEMCTAGYRKKLKNIVQTVLPALQKDYRRINDFTGILQDVRRACKKRLSSVRCAYYDEILEGLLLAVEKTGSVSGRCARPAMGGHRFKGNASGDYFYS